MCCHIFRNTNTPSLSPLFPHIPFCVPLCLPFLLARLHVSLRACSDHARANYTLITLTHTTRTLTYHSHIPHTLTYHPYTTYILAHHSHTTHISFIQILHKFTGMCVVVTREPLIHLSLAHTPCIHSYTDYTPVTYSHTDQTWPTHSRTTHTPLTCHALKFGQK
jgi:hypothetical protein